MKVMSKACVYVLSAGECCKIGIAADPLKRASALNIGRDVPATLAFNTAAMDRKLAESVEKACHTRLSAYRLRGEWFEVDISVAEAVVRVFADYLAPEGSLTDVRAEAALMLLDEYARAQAASLKCRRSLGSTRNKNERDALHCLIKAHGAARMQISDPLYDALEALGIFMSRGEADQWPAFC